jgi:hypothetical protein
MLVTEWARTLEGPLSHVSHYVENFVEWAAHSGRHVGLDDGSSVVSILHSQFRRLAQSHGDELRHLVGGSGHRRREEENDHFVALVTAYEKEECTEDPFPNMSEDDIRSWLNDLSEPLAQILSEGLGLDHVLNLTSRENEALSHFAVECLRRFMDSRDVAGINFIGFGTEDFLGQVCGLMVTGFYGGQLRYQRSDVGSASPGDYPYAISLAQDRAIAPFLHGWGGDIRAHVAESVKAAALEKLSLDEEGAKDIATATLDKLAERMEEYYSTPMFRTLDALGTSALARYADLLIRMEALRSATLPGEATVGGIVESLSVNRPHGVRWHHRISHDFATIEASTHILA